MVAVLIIACALIIIGIFIILSSSEEESSPTESEPSEINYGPESKPPHHQTPGLSLNLPEGMQQEEPPAAIPQQSESPPPGGKADVNKRVCGFMIDLLTVVVIQYGVLIFQGNWHPGYTLLYLFFRDSLGGQSLGKIIIGLQIIDQNNQPASIGRAILRNLIFIIPPMMVIEYVIFNRHSQGKRLGDMMAGTRVVDLKPEGSSSKYVWLSIVLLLIWAILVPGANYWARVQEDKAKRRPIISKPAPDGGFSFIKDPVNDYPIRGTSA